MRLAEQVLRLGAGGVSFVVGYAHCLFVAVVPQIPCDRPDNDPFLGTLVVGIPLLVLLCFCGWGLPFRSGLRWLTLPFALLVPLAVLAVRPYLDADALAGLHVCSASRGWAAASGVTWWHRAWAPFQLAVLVFLSAQALRYWLPAPKHD